MFLERITDGAPHFVVHPNAMPKFQFDEAFVFSDSVRDCKNFSVTDLKVAGKAWSQDLQTTVSAQLIR
jgi:hypothetical protein